MRSRKEPWYQVSWGTQNLQKTKSYFKILCQSKQNHMKTLHITDNISNKYELRSICKYIG